MHLIYWGILRLWADLKVWLLFKDTDSDQQRDEHTFCVLCCMVWFCHLNGCVGEDTGCAEHNPLCALRSSGCCTGLLVLQQVTWGQRELWLDKTCHRRNSASKLWIGNGRERGSAAAWYTPARLHHHSLGEAGWGKLPGGCGTSVCLLPASLDVRSISTIQTSIFGASSWDLCKSLDWVITTQNHGTSALLHLMLNLGSRKTCKAATAS